MTIFDTYSKRKKRAEQAEPDVYQYDRVPATLRNQIQRIWEDAIGPYYDPRPYAYGSAPPHNNAAWHTIRDAVCREKGKLTFSSQPNPMRDCIRYLHSENTIDDWFDLIEFSFLYIDRILGKKHSYDLRSLGIEQKSDDAIEELNFRLLDAGVGYQFESGQIIRIDSEYVHSEIVKPALVLLSDPRFAGAQQEFLAAHE